MGENPISSSVSALDESSNALNIRGRDIAKLAREGGFEEVAFFLLKGEWPGDSERREFGKALSRGLTLDAPSRFAVHAYKEEETPLTSLRGFLTGLSSRESLPCEPLQLSAYLLGRMAACAAGTFRAKKREQLLTPLDSPQSGDRFASKLFFLFFGKPAKRPEEQALDRTLVLFAEAGLSPPTRAVRIAASAGADLVSALCAGLAILMGPLQGEGPAQVVQMLADIGSPQNAGTWLDNTVIPLEDLPGIRNRLFRGEDPRGMVLLEEFRALSRFRNTGSDLALLESLRRELQEGKNLPPSLDFFAGPLLSALGFPPGFFSSLLACSMGAGWIAHFGEAHISPDFRPSLLRGNQA